MSTNRSVQITLVNQTSQGLQLVSDNLIGIFNSPPPSSIPPDGRGSFEAEVRGLDPGIKGKVVYSIQAEPSTIVTLNFDSPFLGTGVDTGNVNNSAFSLTADIAENGKNASVIYTLTNS